MLPVGNTGRCISVSVRVLYMDNLNLKMAFEFSHGVHGSVLPAEMLSIRFFGSIKYIFSDQ